MKITDKHITLPVIVILFHLGISKDLFQCRTYLCSPIGGRLPDHPPASIYARPMWVSRDAVLAPKDLRVDSENRRRVIMDAFFGDERKINFEHFS